MDAYLIARGLKAARTPGRASVPSTELDSHDQDLARGSAFVDPETQFPGEKGDGVSGRQHVLVRSDAQMNPALEHDRELLGPVRHRMLSAPAAPSEGDE